MCLVWVSYMIAGIYKFTNKINGKIYIGQTKSMTNRLRSHLKITTKNPFKRDLELYGWSSFKFEVLEFIENEINLKEILNEREQYFINIHIQMGLNFDTMFYNDILFINKPSYHPDLEQRKKMSDAKIGTKLSKEHRQSMSVSGAERNSAEHLKNFKPFSKNISRGLRKNTKHILKYDMDGNFIKEYETQVDAAESVNGGSYNINKALKNVMYHAYGYQWRYYEDNFPTKIKSLLRRVQVLDYDKKEVNIYNSPVDASRSLGIHVNRIIYALNDSKYNYSGGYYFFYTNEDAQTV